MVGKIDLKGLRRDRDQLFAEAVVRFKRGDHWWPEHAFEQRVIKPEQEGRYESDSGRMTIENYLDGSEPRDHHPDRPLGARLRDCRQGWNRPTRGGLPPFLRRWRLEARTQMARPLF